MALKRMFAAPIVLVMSIMMVGAASGPQIHMEVNSSDVLEEIAGGERVSYDRAIITGDLDLSQLNLPLDDYEHKIVASEIRITNSQFEGDLRFSGSRFDRPINFSGTTFLRNVNFTNSQCVKTAIFSRAQFLGYADFYGTEFKDLLDFDGSIFYKSASFNNTEFNIYSDFSGVIFKGYVFFKDAVIRGYTYFTGSQFEDCASFYRAEFYQETRFDDAKFLRYANFNESRFKDYTYFSGVKFEGPLSLNKTKIPDWIIDWRSVDVHLVYNEAAYLALMQRFWASGDFNAYDDCYYQYRWKKQSLEPIGASKAYDTLAWATCGYGIRPQHTFAFGFVLIILFGLVFWRANLVQRLPVSQSTHQKKKSWFSALEESIYFSIMMFMTRPPYGLHPMERWRYLIILEYILGWLLMALFLVTLGGLMIR